MLPHWKLSVPTVCFDLASFKKDTTNPEIHKQLYLQLISEYPLSEKNNSPTVLKQRKELLRRLYPQNDFFLKQPFTCGLPDDSSIYTAELRAILLALKHVHYSKEKIIFDII